MIVQMAVQSTKSITTILVGDGTDLLDLLCRHADTSARDRFFDSPAKAKVHEEKVLAHQKKLRPYWDQKLAHILFLFMHF